MRTFLVLILGSLSLFAADAQRKATVGAENRIIPHLAFGDTWTTTITLVNVYGTEAAVDLRFFDSNGVPMPVPTDIQGNTSVVRVNLPVAGSKRITIGGGTAIRVGWARVDYDWSVAEVAATAVFRQCVTGRPDSEAVVAADAHDYGYRMQFDELDGYSTGLALANVTGTQALLTVTVRDEAGQPVNQAPVEIVLPSYGHMAFALPAHPVLGPLVKNRRGVIDIRTESSATFSALGLRFAPAGSFTSVVPFTFSGN